MGSNITKLMVMKSIVKASLSYTSKIVVCPFLGCQQHPSEGMRLNIAFYCKAVNTGELVNDKLQFFMRYLI